MPPTEASAPAAAEGRLSGRAKRSAAVWLPAACSLIAVSLLVYGNLAELSVLALVLASAALIAASLRAVAVLRQVKVERERAATALRRAHDEREPRVNERIPALDHMSRQHESILESAGEGILGIDGDDRIVFANRAAAELTGYSVAELVGASAHDLLHHTRADGTPYPIVECPVQKTLADASMHKVFDELYFRKDGSSFPVEYTSTALRERGVLTGAVVVFKDVTERLRTEQESAGLERRLQQSQRLESLGQLAGGIAHDFNNLLAVMLNYASLAREELSPQDEVRQDVDQIYRAAERAAALTRQLLTFSRREVIKPESLDLNAVVSDLEKLLRRTLGEDVVLRTSFGAGLHPVNADRGQLEQVVLNLALNARDAMPAGGTLTIETREPDAGQAGGSDGRWISLRVRDTGCGMTEEVATRAFEPFFTTKPRDKGSGLGLANVYASAAQAGGALQLDSEPGGGTVVEVRFPAGERQTASVPPDPGLIPSPAPARKETILLVEDEHAVREVTRRILAKNGHTVVCAASPREALHRHRGGGASIDLLVTDVVMPEMSGRELVERMRSVDPELRVLYMSGYSDEIVDRHGVPEAGAPFLLKPFDARALLAGVQQALSTEPS